MITAAACGLLACTTPRPRPPDASDAIPVPAAVDPPPTRPEPTPPTTAATPEPLAPPEPDPPAELEAADVEWEESGLKADLDGDGVAETIRFTCASDLRITVGRAKAREAFRVSELIGCSAAVVTLRPGEPTRQIVFTVDEHEEAGPDLHFLYGYRGAKLQRLWSDSAEITFLVDGRWSTETSDCDDTAGWNTTTTRLHRWDGTRVTSETKEQRTAVEPGDCADP